MAQNQKKTISLTSLYSMFIDCAVSGHLYLDYQRYGIPLLLEPKCTLYMHNYTRSGYIKVYIRGEYFESRLSKEHSWLIGKYG